LTESDVSLGFLIVLPFIYIDVFSSSVKYLPVSFFKMFHCFYYQTTIRCSWNSNTLQPTNTHFCGSQC